MTKKKIKKSFQKTLKGFKQFLPIIFGVIMLIGLSVSVIPISFYGKVFTGNNFFDVFLGAITGSVAAGNPITSYIIGGKFLDQGVGLLPVTAFILTWVAVGLVQLPAESLMLGRKFAITRNVVSFISAIFISILTVITLRLI